MKSARRVIAYGSVAAVLAGLSALAASRLPVARQRAYDLGVVPSSAALRLASAGHPTLAANLWWLRAVQYIGEPLGDERGWEKLAPALQLVTDLDPRHGYAYQVGGNMLGSVGRIDEADALLEKGVRNVPDRYILPFHRAVNAFLYEGDYALAGRWFERAARTPGAPPHVAEYAAAMYAKGGAADTAIAFLGHLYRSAEDDESRKALRKQLDQAFLERDAAGLEAAAEAFRARYGVRPVALAQLVFEGLVARVPPDPFGGEYYLDPEGRVRSTVNPRRFERPLTPAQRAAEARQPALRVRSMMESMPP